MRKTILAAVLVAVLAPSAAGEGKLVKDHGVLAGLQGTYLVIEPIDIEESKMRLSKSAVLRTANAVLRRNKIPTLSRSQRDEANHGAILSLDVHVNSIDHFCTLAHKEVVMFARNPEMKMQATTWENSDFGVSEGDSKEVLKAVENLFEMFAKDYLRANPKKAPEPAKKK